MAELVFDIGVSNGADTAFYLAKGFDVVGVEADPATCEQLRERFGAEIATGRFSLYNNAASDVSGKQIRINVHQAYQALSGIGIRAEPGGYIHHDIPSIDWATLRARHGMPRYLKVDIEGSERDFMVGMLKDGQAPEFISLEAYQFEPVRMLQQLGYSRFKMIDQKPGGLRLPDVQREGHTIEWTDFDHASGPFGLDVFGDGEWESFAQVTETWKRCSERFHETWFDCHAWKAD